MKLLIIFVSITTVMCIDLFHFPMAQIHKARYNCTANSSIEETCHDLCALEISMMLTPEENAINVNEFGPYHQIYANECWTFKSKPSCKEAEDFLECYYQKSKLANDESLKICREQNPVKNETEFTLELLDEDRDQACLATCLGEYMFAFNDDDTINMDCINPHIPFKFDAKQAAKECEDNNKHTDKCQKRATNLFCLNKAFEKAVRKEYSKEQSEQGMN